MTHTCNALILHCIDFRFGKAIKNYMEENRLLGDCDIISIAGAAKNIASPANDDVDRDFVLNQIALSKKLHGVEKVILMNHTDCGAYGGRAAFNSDENEHAAHADDLKRSKEIVQSFYPDIKIQLVLARINPQGGVDFETID